MKEYLKFFMQFIFNIIGVYPIIFVINNHDWSLWWMLVSLATMPMCIFIYNYLAKKIDNK